MVEHPGRQADGRIGDTVEGLGALVHFDGVGDMVRKEVVQLLVRALLIGGQSCGRWRACLDGIRQVVGNRPRHVGVDAQQSRRRLDAHPLRYGRPPIAALGDVAGVANALHQLVPGTRDTEGIPASRGRLG